MSSEAHKLYIETVGCQMNMLDSEMVVASLRREGYELANNVQDADTILFNTCSVREQAENKTYSALGRLRAEKKNLLDESALWLDAGPLGVFRELGVRAVITHTTRVSLSSEAVLGRAQRSLPATLVLTIPASTAELVKDNDPLKL